MVMQNAAGFDMQGAAVAISGDCTSAAGAGVDIPNGQKTTFTSTCAETFTSGEKLKAAIAFTYGRADSGLNHTSQGELIIKAP